MIVKWLQTFPDLQGKGTGDRRRQRLSLCVCASYELSQGKNILPPSIHRHYTIASGTLAQWAVFKTCVVAALQFRDRSLPLSTAVNETSRYCTKTWQYHKNVLRRLLRRHPASPRSLQKLFLEKTARAGPRSLFLQSKISLKESEMTLRLQEAILKVSRFPAGPPSSVPNPYNHPPSFSSYPTMASGGYTPYRLTAIYPVVISLPSSITQTWAGCARCHRPAVDTKMMVVVTSDAAAPLVRQYLSWTLCDWGRHLKYYTKSLLFFTTCSSSKILSEQGQWGRCKRHGLCMVCRWNIKQHIVAGCPT